MFGIIDRSSKEARVFSVYDDRRKEKLLPIISNNVETIDHNDGDIDLRTRVYSDCFSAYLENDFNAMYTVYTELITLYGLVGVPFIQKKLRGFGQL